MKERELYRLRKGKWLAGVCTGMADYMNVPVSVIRGIFVLMVFLAFGAGILVYIASIFMIHWDPTEEISREQAPAEEPESGDSQE